MHYNKLTYHIDYCTGQCKYKTRILSSLVKCSCFNRANLPQNIWDKQNNSVANINSDHNVTVSDYCLNFLWRGISILFIDILLNFQTNQIVTWKKRSCQKRQKMWSLNKVKIVGYFQITSFSNAWEVRKQHQSEKGKYWKYREAGVLHEAK